MSFKAHEKRVKTLLVEYKNQFKGNSFNDKRIGENDKNMSLEDKMFKRFVAERQKLRDRKSNKFNLNDDEFDKQKNKIELTHFGQSLSQIERFEKVALSDDDEDDEDDPDRGKINADFVSKNFFGGFDDKEENIEGKKKNRKEWIEEMIAKSKLIKYERQKERDRTLDLTEELDKEWKDIMPLIGKMNNELRKEEEKQTLKTSKPDDYDVLVRSLQFESEKATPSNKLKTVEELEKERLEALCKNEKKLIERMNNEVEEIEEELDTKKKKSLKKAPSNHISPDDIEFDDPEYLEMLNRKELSEKHKKMNEELEYQDKKDEKEREEDEEEADEEEEGSEGEESEKSENDDDDMLNEEKSDAEGFKNEKWLKQFENFCMKMNTNAIDIKQFESLLKSLILKLDPSKDEKNKNRICFLTQHLIIYYQSLFKFKSPSNIAIDMNLVNLLTKYIYDFTLKYGNKSTKKEPSPYVTLFRNILINLNKEFLNLKISERRFPHLDTLFTFKLISNVFPTSDFRHQIVTPSILIMTRYLIQCQIQNIGDLFRGLFLCNLCYEFVKKSLRFIPECIQYLNGVLYIAVDWKNIKKDDSNLSEYELSTIFESFKRTKVKINFSKKCEKLVEISLVNMSIFDKIQTDDSTKASIISYCIDILTTFTKMYTEMSSFREVFNVTKKLLSFIKFDNNPNELTERIIKLEDLIVRNSENPREYLKSLIKKPIANKQHEPKIQSKTKYNPKHHNAVISEKQLLARKYKKELKSAIKDIRQDNQFLARVQLEEQLEKDAKRAQKVKEIMGSLANQEGEYQKIKRQKI